MIILACLLPVFLVRVPIIMSFSRLSCFLMRNCGMWKVKCGMDHAEICCRMMCKMQNAESLTYSVAAQG